MATTKSRAKDIHHHQTPNDTKQPPGESHSLRQVRKDRDQIQNQGHVPNRLAAADHHMEALALAEDQIRLAVVNRQIENDRPDPTQKAP